METAKVDIRKLQLLNDRINQVIDALHQVRLSVHALQQSQQMQQPYGAGFGTPYPNPFVTQSMNPFQQQQGYGQGFNPMLGQGQGQGQGWQGFGQSFGQGFGQTQGTNPGLLHTTGLPFFGGAQGLSHTGTEQDLFNYNRPIGSDPSLAARVTHTFPYLQYSVPPVVTLF
jgi:hypothetical protein